MEKYNDFERLRSYVGRIISKRSYTESALRKKILHYTKSRSLSITDENIESLITITKQSNLVNDSEYVRRFIADRLRFHPRSKKMLAYELKTKGIDQSLVDQLLNDYNEEEALCNIIEAKKNYGREKLIQYLLTQGFPYDLITKKVGNFVEK